MSGKHTHSWGLVPISTNYCEGCGHTDWGVENKRLEATIARLRKRVKGLRQALRNEQKFNARLRAILTAAISKGVSYRLGGVMRNSGG